MLTLMHPSSTWDERMLPTIRSSPSKRARTQEGGEVARAIAI